MRGAAAPSPLVAVSDLKVQIGTDDGLVLTAAPVGGAADGVTVISAEATTSASVNKSTQPRRRRPTAK